MRERERARKRERERLRSLRAVVRMYIYWDVFHAVFSHRPLRTEIRARLSARGVGPPTVPTPLCPAEEDNMQNVYKRYTYIYIYIYIHTYIYMYNSIFQSVKDGPGAGSSALQRHTSPCSRQACKTDQGGNERSLLKP